MSVIESFVVRQDVLQRPVELVFIEGESGRIGTPAGVGLAADKPAHATVGQVRAEIDAVFQAVDDVPFAVDAVKNPHALGQVDLCTRNHLGNGVRP